MTGFGKASGKIDGRTLNVEIKSLNSQKGLDLSIKFPSKYREYEYALRNKTANVLQRGKIDIFITLDVYAEMFHVFQAFWLVLSLAKKANAQLGQFLNKQMV